MYTIGDFLIQLKNSNKAHKKTIEYPHSKVVYSIAKILEKEGLLEKVSITQEKVGKTERKYLKLDLKYQKSLPSISEIKLISKPSVHRYIGKSKIYRAVQKNAVGIVSTNKGVMTTRDAHKKGVGGELICQIL